MNSQALDTADLRQSLESILNAYSIIYFSRGKLLGAVFLLATFLAPTYGLFGLAGVMTAFVAARVLCFNRAAVHSGELLYNSLMVSLGLAHLTYFHPIEPPLILVLLPTVAIAALLLTVALNRLNRQLFGLSAFSLPFILITVLLYFLFYSLTGTPVVGEAPSCLLPDLSLPAYVSYFFQSLGATFFLPNVAVGIVIFLMLILQSRLLVLLALWGFITGNLFLQLTGLSAGAFGAGWLGTNFIFCGIALGGIYYIPSRSSLLLAGFCPILCVLVAIGMRTFLRNYNIPPLSFPFVVVMLAIVTALRQRERFPFLFENESYEGTPEEIARRFQLERLRFPDAAVPAIFLPFSGERVVTQGFDGDITHQSHWRHALDFEVLDGSGEPIPAQRTQLEDAYTFCSTVLAPCDGTILRVVNHVQDNQLGAENRVENWGNLAVLQTDFGSFVLLCHFKHQGVVVAQNQRVSRGQLLGYCGNSGRSPLPHLHLQMQATRYPGSATIPFCLCHYVTHRADSNPIFSLTGIPTIGDRIAPLDYDPEITGCFMAGISTRVRYRIESRGKILGWETIETTSTGWGYLQYRSVERGTILKATILEGVHIVQDLAGSPKSILGLFGMGLSMLPFSKDRSICWEDSADSRPFRTSLRGWIDDIFTPYKGAVFLNLLGCFKPTASSGEIVVATEIIHEGKSRVLQCLEVRLSKEVGVIEMTATFVSGSVRIVQERWESL
jgi:urea transporter/murein DD-endopeptidase MepM/ murein hydrolase activator NlpD